jgi:hypothetical protein
MTETWKPVVGYEGMYEVSSLGNVRALDRVIKRCKCGEPLVRKKGAPVRWIMRPDAYPRVSLSRGNKRVQRLVHRMVLETFVGPCPDGMEACHNNGKRGDPSLLNLRWATTKENHADKWAHGTMLVGEKTNSVKLTELQVREIRASQHSKAVLAKRYRVSLSAIARVRNRQTWTHI